MQSSRASSSGCRVVEPVVVGKSSRTSSSGCRVVEPVVAEIAGVPIAGVVEPVAELAGVHITVVGGQTEMIVGGKFLNGLQEN